VLDELQRKQILIDKERVERLEMLVVCCSVLQCAAVCCSVLQCVAACSMDYSASRISLSKIALNARIGCVCCSAC